MPEQSPQGSGFIGSTAVFTAWGACRLHDLARLSMRRDATVDITAASIDALQQTQAQSLVNFDAQTEQLLADAPEDERAAIVQQRAGEREVLVVAQQNAAHEHAAYCAANIAAALPEIRINAATTQNCECVVVDETLVSALVEVVISEDPSISVRCTGDCLFVTEQGSVAASDLAGKTIHRSHANGSSDTYVVPNVTPIVLDTPVPVYRIQGVLSYCVGDDSSVAAIVHLS